MILRYLLALHVLHFLSFFRAELEDKYRESLKLEIAKLVEKHKRELTAAKKKQWCWQCESEVGHRKIIYLSGGFLIFFFSSMRHAFCFCATTRGPFDPVFDPYTCGD